MMLYYSSFTSETLNPETKVTDSTTVSLNALTQTVCKLTLMVIEQ